MQNNLLIDEEDTKIWFYRMLRMPFTEHVSNDELLVKMETKITLQKRTDGISSAYKEENVLRKLTLTVHIEGNRDKEKQCMNYQMSFSKWLVEQ